MFKFTWLFAGGGILWIDIRNKLEIDGTISSNGENGTSSTGGGSGGSIYIKTNHLEGKGIVQVIRLS